MSDTSLVPVFDGHNDTLTHIRNAAPEDARSFLKQSSIGHVDLPRARAGGLAGGFFAIFTTSPGMSRIHRPLLDEDGEVVPGGWSVDLPPKLDRRTAYSYTVSVMSDLFRLVEESAGGIEVVRTASALTRCIEDGTFAVILHIEGAEAIDTRLETLDVFYEAGLRSLGPVWSRPNAFAHGVPFDFPRHPDTGPGLTRAGRRLVKRCNELGVMIDLSHLNAQGFWDVARISEAPLVATHSNAHALSATPRNLTDAQLDVVALSGGVVGLNYAVAFLRGDGKHDPETPLTEIARHARYIADLIGVRHVALGSDFDGAMIPGDLRDVTRLPMLLQALRDIGFSEDEVRAIAYRNWVRVLKATWGE
ncbi:MAG: dipeptidase [Gemmatimonadetes bacterium]|nr:dipeptidase [Gemmatimonadota bacterium]MDA1102314.1 dipeptidase [Gemmatimonadota bacterium]